MKQYIHKGTNGQTNKCNLQKSIQYSNLNSNLNEKQNITIIIIIKINVPLDKINPFEDGQLVIYNPP